METLTLCDPQTTSPQDILREVAALIRRNPRNYWQDIWHHVDPDCGTVCCIAGWTVAIVDGLPEISPPSTEIQWRAIELLRLLAPQADRLFAGDALATQWSYEHGDIGSDGLNCHLFLPENGSPEYAELGIRHIHRFMVDEWGYTGPDL